LFRRREDEEDDASNESEEDEEEDAAAAALEVLLPLPRGVRAPPLRDDEKSDEYDEKAPPESPASEPLPEYPLWLLAASPLPFEEENEEDEDADEATGASPLCAAK
jgi:hypothetical protein